MATAGVDVVQGGIRVQIHLESDEALGDIEMELFFRVEGHKFLGRILGGEFYN